MDTAYPRPLLLALGAAADAAGLEELAAAILTCVIGTVGVDSAVVAYVHQGAPSVTTWTWPDGFFNDVEASRFERLNRDEPWILATHTRVHHGGPLRISDRLPQHEFRRLAVYSEVFRPLEIDHQVAFSLPGGPSGSTCVAVNRSRRDFADRELEWLEILRRPLSAVITPAVSRLGPLEDRSRERSRGLSDREGAVLALVAEGHSNHQVGRRLGISARTVEKHLERVYTKTGTRNRTDATAWWLTARPWGQRPTTGAQGTTGT